jgi:phosphate transport system protein
MYIKRHLDREIEGLKNKLLELGTLVEDNLYNALNSIQKEDITLAEKVINSDQIIDKKEVDLEEDCLKTLALYQPVAADLRFIVSILKINNDLERIGDLAVNIAERVDFIKALEEKDIIKDVIFISHKASDMLKKSLDAFVNLDPKLAKEVCESDDVIDEINTKMYEKIRDEIIRRPDYSTERLLRVLTTSRDLERIGDHATNIAEGVIYLIEGDIVRHRMFNYKA